MKPMEKAKVIKVREGLKAKQPKPSKMETAKPAQLGGISASQAPLGGITANQSQLGGITAMTPADLIAEERKKKLMGEVELGPTTTIEYTPVTQYLKKKGAK